MILPKGRGRFDFERERDLEDRILSLYPNTWHCLIFFARAAALPIKASQNLLHRRERRGAVDQIATT